MRDYDGSVIQMRMAYSAVAHFLVQWTDCRLASALGLLKIMIFKVDYFFLLPLQNRFLPCEFTCVLLRAATEYINFDQFRILRTQVYPDDGTTSMPAWEREANIREFYGRHLSNQSVTLFPPSLGSDSFLPVLPASPGWLAAGVLFPSLLQLPSGITELDDKKQRRLCVDRFRRRDAGFSQLDLERELECGICLEANAKIVLPDCTHSLCLSCFEHWYEIQSLLLVRLPAQDLFLPKALAYKLVFATGLDVVSQVI
jgi:hypothetical protein